MTDTPIGDAITERLRHAHTEYLDAIRQQVNELIALPTPDDSEVADIVGEVRALEVKLAEWRRGLVAETPAVAGEKYQIVTGRKATRTYNTAALLTTAAQGRPFDQTIRELVAEGALRLSWQWTKVQRYFTDHQLELRVAKGREVPDGDLDAPHVGEVWSDTTAIKSASDE